MEKFIQKNYKKIVLLICILGILFRTVYIVKSPIRKNQYDCKIWSLYDLEDYEGAYELNEENIGKAGHMYYILTIYNTFRLPEGSGGQYYHPPLHHFISAMWLRFMDLFPLNAVQKLESLQLLSLGYSIIIILFIYKILEKTKINEIGKVLSLILVNFFPLFIYMSGFINNDILLSMFLVLSLYYIIKWDEQPSLKNTLILATVFGLGMMTKTSMMVMMLPLVFVVAKRFIKNIKNIKIVKKIIIEAIIFVLIVSAASLWFPIRQYIKYDFELFGIQKPYEHFYSGDASILERWGIISDDILKNGIEIEDKNIFSYVINSGLYCLQTLTNSISYMIKEITIILGLIALILVIKTFVQKIIKKDIDNNLFTLLVTFVAWVIGFIVFNISLPYSCTMNSRYIVMLFIISMIILGNSISECKSNVWKQLIYALAILLSIFSVIVLFSKPI